MFPKGFLALCLIAAPGFCGTFFVSMAGSADNDGSSGRPWPSVQFALDKVGGGHTIVLKPGVYPGPIAIPKSASGTPESPTIIQSETKWKAVVMGSTTHGVYTADSANWVTIDGLEVTGAMADGIKMQGDFGVVRNCWVHGSTAMGVSAHGRKGFTIERNLIEFNGQNPQFHHGIYADGDGYMIRDNIVRHNAGYGMQVYPAASNGYILNNLIYGQARKPGLVVQSPKGGGHNVISSNTIADNPGGGLTLYSPDSEVVVNNIITSTSAPIVMSPASPSVWFAHNLCQPACDVNGENNITGDPQFVYASRGAYFLMPASPAAGKGKLELAPEQDFWGRTRSKDEPTDIGAFPFVPYLATDQSRASWYSGYAYRYSLNKGQDMPDLWTMPLQAASSSRRPITGIDGGYSLSSQH